MHEITGPTGGSVSTEALSHLEALRVLYDAHASTANEAPTHIIYAAPEAPKKKRQRRKKRRKAWKPRRHK